MTSPTGTTEKGIPLNHAAFTLVELILVMGLLAAVVVSSAPAMSRFFQERKLGQEATRFLALTEFARSESISQGVPMIVWINPADGKFGMQPREGFPSRLDRTRTYRLHDDIELTPGPGVSADGSRLDIMAFAPDGTLEPEAAESVSLKDRSGSERVIAQSENKWNYEILDPSTDEVALRR